MFCSCTVTEVGLDRRFVLAHIHISRNQKSIKLMVIHDVSFKIPCHMLVFHTRQPILLFAWFFLCSTRIYTDGGRSLPTTVMSSLVVPSYTGSIFIILSEESTGQSNQNMESDSAARGNHFGCTGQGQASVGVFGMMSSTILAVQVTQLMIPYPGLTLVI